MASLGHRSCIVLAWCLSGCAGGTPDDRPATFTYVSVTVLQPACATANCHSGIAQAAHLRFDTIDEGYRSLMEEEEDLVVPERPDLSKLMKVIGGQDAAGEEEDDDLMPPDAPLADDDVDLVRRWILAGAEKD